MTEENKKPEETKKPTEAKAAEKPAETKAEAKPTEAKTEKSPSAKPTEANTDSKDKAKPVATADAKKPEANPAEPKASKPYVEKAPSKPEAKDTGADSRQSRGPGGPGGRGPGGPGGNRGPRGQGGGHGGNRRGGGRDHQEPSEYTEKVVQVRRVTKVCKGGKKLSFRVTVIIGNEKGKVGVGVGKAAEVLIAIKKGISDARKKVVEISTVKNTNTISHTVTGIAGGSNVMLKPAADGTGIIAGGTARIVLELAGVGDILSKSKGSKSPLNVARATVNALGQLRSFQEVASLRGISVKKMIHG